MNANKAREKIKPKPKKKKILRLATQKIVKKNYVKNTCFNKVKRRGKGEHNTYSSVYVITNMTHVLYKA